MQLGINTIRVNTIKKARNGATQVKLTRTMPQDISMSTQAESKQFKKMAGPQTIKYSEFFVPSKDRKDSAVSSRFESNISVVNHSFITSIKLSKVDPTPNKNQVGLSKNPTGRFYEPSS